LKRSSLGVTIILALLIGAGIGYYLLGGSTVPPSACAYLASNYNASVGLISETPSHARYFLYSDNYLAALVLPKDCNNSSLAENINKTLSEYNASKIPNQFMVFDCKQDFQGAENYNLSDHISATVNNQTGAPLNESYADIAFLEAYYNAKCEQNTSGAIDAFNAGARMYNGIGFNDTAFREGTSQGVYQTYKLALYVYTAKLLKETVPPSALVNLLRMQAPSRGFYTGYDANLSNDGTSTNAETTCLAIMAMEAVSIY
jgi:hypothetical protein